MIEIILIAILVFVIFSMTYVKEGYSGRHEKHTYMNAPSYEPNWMLYYKNIYDPARYKYGYWPYYGILPYLHDSYDYFFNY